jgi:CheY-like chemotaxis protein
VPAAVSTGAIEALRGPRVLVVDDNDTNLRILVAQLERLGLEVTATTEPREARKLATVAPANFAIVLSDYRMPDLDGIALAAAIHGSGIASPPPVVILSSAGQRDREATGVVAFLSKPVKPGALRDAVVAVLSGSAVREAARPDRPSADAGLAARHPLRILLAEDNAVNQKLALRLLERMGYPADVAANGLEAIAALESTPYDVVLMDIQMPELDGLEASRQIRSRWPDRRLRIVAMTANAMEGDRDACIAAGMDDYVSKPIRPDELAAALAAAGPPDRAPDSIAEADTAATA